MLWDGPCLADEKCHVGSRVGRRHSGKGGLESGRQEPIDALVQALSDDWHAMPFKEIEMGVERLPIEQVKAASAQELPLQIARRPLPVPVTAKNVRAEIDEMDHHAIRLERRFEKPIQAG